MILLRLLFLASGAAYAVHDGPTCDLNPPDPPARKKCLDGTPSESECRATVGCCWELDPLLILFSPQCYKNVPQQPLAELPNVYLVLTGVLLAWAIAPHMVILVQGLQERSSARTIAVAAAGVSESEARAPLAQEPGLIEELVEEDQLKLEWSGVRNCPTAPNVRIEQLIEGAPPEKVAIISSTGMQITYRTLEQRSSAVASAIAPFLSGDSRRCALFTKRSPEMLYGMFGILKAGAAYIPLPPSFPADRILYILEDSGAQLIVTMTELVPQVTEMTVSVPIVNISEVCDATDGSQPFVSPFVNTCEDGFVIFYTSGSTGKPKGVELTHRAEATAVIDHAQRFVHASDKVLQNMPFNFDVSVTDIYSTLAAHATLVLAPPTQQDMAALNRVIEQMKPDVAQFIPSVFSVYVGFHGIPKSPRFFGFIGEVLPVKVWTDLQRDAISRSVLNLYGPTEVSVQATYFGPEPAIDIVSAHGSVPIGRPLKWRECYVMAAEGPPYLVSKGASGELWLAGAGLANGYVNLPEKTAKAFVSHPFRADDRAYRTGDLVKWLDSGDLLYLGRIDTQIKLHGLRIELEEIENVLREEASVTEVAVVKHEAPGTEPLLVAYISPATASSQAALVQCRAKLPAYMVPSAVVPLDEWPRNGTGKIDRNELASRPLQAGARNEGASGGVVMGLDSLAQMRLFSRAAVQERARLQSLLGFAVVVMCFNHWEHGQLVAGMNISPNPEIFAFDKTVPLGEGLYWGLVHLFTPVFLDVFIMFAAYTESTALGLDGSSDAFRFTVHELLLILLWMAWTWPFMEIQAAFVGMVTWSPKSYSSILEGMDTFGYRWILLFLVMAKACTVSAHKLKIPPWAQLSVIGICCVLAYTTDWPWLFPFSIQIPRAVQNNTQWILHCPGNGNHCDLNSPMNYGPGVYLMYLFIYVGTVHYGRALLTYCTNKRDSYSNQCKNVGVRLLALFGVLVLHIDPTAFPPSVSWLGLVTGPLKLFLLVYLVPRSRFFAYMGRNLLGTFLTHLSLKQIWCFTGFQLHYSHDKTLLYFPSVQWTTAKLNGVLPDWGILEGVVAFLILTAYAVLFCSVIGPAFQIFLIQTVQAIVGTIQWAGRLISRQSLDSDAKPQDVLH